VKIQPQWVVTPGKQTNKLVVFDFLTPYLIGTQTTRMPQLKAMIWLIAIHIIIIIISSSSGGSSSSSSSSSSSVMNKL
jgi:hypothetical protein